MSARLPLIGDEVTVTRDGHPVPGIIEGFRFGVLWAPAGAVTDIALIRVAAGSGLCLEGDLADVPLFELQPAQVAS